MHKFCAVAQSIFLGISPVVKQYLIITHCQVPSRVGAWFHDLAGDIDYSPMSLSQSEWTILHESIILVYMEPWNSEWCCYLMFNVYNFIILGWPFILVAKISRFYLHYGWREWQIDRSPGLCYHKARSLYIWCMVVICTHTFYNCQLKFPLIVTNIDWYMYICINVFIQRSFLP